MDDELPVDALPRVCQWLMQNKDWEDCGERATHAADKLGLAFCERHADVLSRYYHELTAIEVTE